jgi:hypothetical protein
MLFKLKQPMLKNDATSILRHVQASNASIDIQNQIDLVNTLTSGQ